MAESPSQMGYAETPEGVSIAYRTSGDGPRDIVILLPGNTVDVMFEDPVFDGVVRRLGELGRVVCFDWRGFGSSDPLEALPTPEQWMDDIRVVLDQIDSTDAVIIAAVAVGTMGLLFAATYPERTAALVLVDTFACATADEDLPFALDAAAKDMFIEALHDLMTHSGGATLDVPSRASESGFAEWYWKMNRLTVSRGLLRGYWRWNLAVDPRPALPAISAPVLVLHHEHNALVPPAHSPYLAERIEGARIEMLAGPAENWLLSRETSRQVLDHVQAFVTGAPPPVEPDRVLATVLFTDIVGSTEQALRLGDAEWRRVLDAHDRLVTSLIDAHRGRWVKSTGDGVLATFDGPGRAVRCAQAIAGAVTELGIEVRSGLHTGEVELRGEDIGGIGVHIGARIAALAGPGEVLVDATVRDLVTGSGLQFEDRGAATLKGLPDPWSIFAARG